MCALQDSITRVTESIIHSMIPYQHWSKLNEARCFIIDDWKLWLNARKCVTADLHNVMHRTGCNPRVARKQFERNHLLCNAVDNGFMVQNHLFIHWYDD